MKLNSLNKVLVTMLILTTAPISQAKSLSVLEINTIRQVLRAANIDESQLSNNDIEALRSRGHQILSYEKNRNSYFKKVEDGSVYLTCGAGSHGGDGDPVRFK